MIKPDSLGSDSNLPPEQEFGEFLQQLRENKGWSQAEVARQMGVSRQSVSMWEAGVNHPARRRLYQLLQLLDAPQVAFAVPQKNPQALGTDEKGKFIPFVRTRQEGSDDRFSLGPDYFDPIPKPAFIAAPRYVICFLMPDTSMVPWRSLGEPVFVDLSRRASIGDHALIRFGKEDGKVVDRFLKGPFIVRLITDIGPVSVRTKCYWTSKEETFAAPDVMAFYILEWHELFGPMAASPSINN